MRLLDWMKANGIGDAEMAERIGGKCTPAAVKKYKYGEVITPLDRILRIQEITDGKVMPADHLPKPKPAHPPPPSTIEGAPATH